MPHSIVQRTALASALLTLLCASAYAQTIMPAQAASRGAPLPTAVLLPPLRVASNPVISGEAAKDKHIVIRQATQISLNAKATIYGYDVTTDGAFKAANQKTPYERLDIQYTLDGKDIPAGVGYVNDDGSIRPYWSWTTNPEFAAGEHKLVATFKGNDRLLGSTGETVLHILKAKAKLYPYANNFQKSSTSDNSSVANGYFDLSARLVMDRYSDKPLAGEQVDILLLGKKVATVTTDSSGHAKYRGPGIQTPVGQYAVEFRFNGNKNFLSLTSGPETVTVAH